MTKLFCNQCCRIFSAWQYFEQHLNAPSGRLCHKVYFQRLKPRVYSTSVKHKDKTPTEHNNELRPAGSNDLINTDDCSVFDFNDSDIHHRETTEAPPDNDCNPLDADPSITSIENPEPLSTDNDNPDRSLLEKFRAYVERSEDDRCDLPPELAAGAELMKLMDSKGGNTTLYNHIFKWHVKYIKATQYVSADRLYSKLLERYDLEDTLPYEKPIELPSNKTKMNVVLQDAGAVLRDMMTDPIATDKDYLFHNGDPFADPPKEFLVIRDINTGLNFREMHDKLIKPKPYSKTGRRRVLKPVLVYNDACVTGQFENLSIEILKICSGIFNAEYRKNDWAWQNLGFINHYVPGSNKAVEMLEESAHVDAKTFIKYDELRQSDSLDQEADTLYFDSKMYIDGDDPDQAIGGATIPEIPAQDLHKQLATILAPYVALEDREGIDWDLRYNGKTWEMCVVPFIISVLGDTVGHDKHCGKFSSRTEGVKCLCRYCTLPTSETDQPYHDEYPIKTQKMIQDLIKKGDLVALKAMSQHVIWNAWYPVRFAHPGGIHQSCPIEILHWILLGMYKYSRLSLFEQTGKTSILSTNLNALAINMGFLFQRQSDRERPRTSFSKGVKQGKLMGHEMTGMMLVLAASLRSSKGRSLVLDTARGKQKGFFANEGFLNDWIMLIETQLQFEAWLSLPELKVASVERARLKVKELMGMSKVIGKRQEGMKYQTFNFHGTEHVPEDILRHGVPSVVNTMSNEMHHKRDKRSAMRTQKRPGSFDIQTARNIQRRRAIDYAMLEMDGMVKWRYYEREADDMMTPVQGKNDTNSGEDVSTQLEPTNGQLTGAKARFFRHPERPDEWVYEVISRMSNKHMFRYSEEMVAAIIEIADFVERHGFHDLIIYTELVVSNGKSGASLENQVYRASPFYAGKPWNDWGIFDLSYQTESGSDMPGQIHCFVDLRGLPEENDLNYEPAIYAIIEPAIMVTEGWDISDLFKPYTKMTKNADGFDQPITTKELVNVKDIKEPAVLIPDLENPNQRAYLRMTKKRQWSQLFENWLNDPHERNFDTAQL